MIKPVNSPSSSIVPQHQHFYLIASVIKITRVKINWVGRYLDLYCKSLMLMFGLRMLHKCRVAGWLLIKCLPSNECFLWLRSWHRGIRKILRRCTYISLQSHTILDIFNKPADEKLFLPLKGKPKMKLVDCKHITRSLTAAQLSVIFEKNWIPSTFVRSWKFMRIFNKCVTNQILAWPHCHCSSSSCLLASVCGCKLQKQRK